VDSKGVVTVVALWLTLDIVTLLAVAYIARVLIQQAAIPSAKFKRAASVVATYSALVLGVYIYMMYDTGYTLFGALLFGGFIASIHIVLLGGFVMIILSS
jgi:hypothetical protein